MLFLTTRRRRRLKERPFPPGWLGILEKRVHFFPLLSPEDRQELQDHIQVFTSEKNFEGGCGFVITDEIRVVIAAYGCLLLLHREHDYYPGLSSIIVYPDEFVAPYRTADEDGIVTEGEDIRSGESWEIGTLVLSWEDMLLGGREGYEDYNVILHEFAHQLDYEEGITGGEPILGRRPRLWEQFLEEPYEQLAEDAAAGRPTVLDPYGAESPEEFFAVTVETFFTAPALLQQNLPELYSGLKRFFRQDPAAWNGS